MLALHFLEVWKFYSVLTCFYFTPVTMLSIINRRVKNGRQHVHQPNVVGAVFVQAFYYCKAVGRSNSWRLCVSFHTRNDIGPWISVWDEFG